MLIVFVVVTVFGAAFSNPISAKPKCGYDSCNDAERGVLNVHIVPHTHDDVGWLKTVDQYYYGLKNNIQLAGVQYILDSVVQELWKDPKRKFIYVETAFFWKWWNDRPESLKEKMRVLINEGRLTFIGGAWSMNDEAVTHYQSTIDQFTFGLNKLNTTFGKCGIPKIGWQIDPFGHSREFASLLAAMGYDGLFHGRIDYQDLMIRKKQKTMEMIWRGDDDLGKSSDIFTSVLYNRYSPPSGFCFDVLCRDEPIVDDLHSSQYNVDKRVLQFLEVVKNMSESYMTNNILITMGEDFNYQSADMWYHNLDKLIEYTNLKAAKENLRVKLFYSTPLCYLKAVKEAKPNLPTKSDDFFPYGSGPHEYWTGFYTSRPTVKYFEREGNKYLQAVKQLQITGKLEHHNKYIIDELRNAMGVMQHHDAVTGTEKQHVTHDYEKILDTAIQDALVVARQALSKFMFNEPETPPLSFDRCHLNMSQCDTSETSQSFIVTLYNPLAWKINVTPVKLPVMNSLYSVVTPNGDEIDYQLLEIPEAVLKNPVRKSKATHDLVFLAYNIKPLGYKNFYITKIDHNRSMKIDKLGEFALGDDPYIIEKFEDDEFLGNEALKIRVNGVTGEISNIQLKDEHESPFTVKMLHYIGETRGTPSGAYIFRPNDNAKQGKQANKTTYIHRGKILDEYQNKVSDYITSVIRVYKHPKINYIEHEWIVGPIPIEDKNGREIIVRYNTNINNKEVFYTDSNGKQILKRVVNKRPDWDLNVTEPIASNYYPIVNRIFIEDNEKRMSVLTDRAEGGTSLKNGEIELMLHRRLLKDDGLGVNEALNETAYDIGLIAQGKHKIYINKLNVDTNIKQKSEVLETHLQPIILVSNAERFSLENWLMINNCFGILNESLPVGLHLLTLEPWGLNTMILRLENYLEKTDKNNTNIKINVKTMLNSLDLRSIRETNLAANLWLKYSVRVDFSDDSETAKVKSTVDDDYNIIKKRSVDNFEDFNVELKAKQIRTFIVEYK